MPQHHRTSRARPKSRDREEAGRSGQTLESAPTELSVLLARQGRLSDAPGDMLRMQSLMGNRAVSDMVEGGMTGPSTAGVPMVQRTIHKPHPEGKEKLAEKWNVALEEAETHGANATLEWAADQEVKFFEETPNFNSLSVALTLFGLRLKGERIEHLDAKKLDEGQADGLDWSEMLPVIRDIEALGFCTVNVKGGTGGHNAITWSVKSGSDELVGSIPQDSHGRSEKIDVVRGAIKKAIQLHNKAVTAEQEKL